ncbi:PD-(D/E)XK nuclease superfamily protein [Magnetospirillum sp. ME-1]|uniref:PD-(D/E)XK nuclease superfamily protein n=1 Tax=Magnetospirillum sp. ME-1 TaxID=1639348 RepID=UPI0011AEA30B|nr:PD-(D/E)XK nuclease superfamily protein [Magnetospirillum sp. ME-1]
MALHRVMGLLLLACLLSPLPLAAAESRHPGRLPNESGQELSAKVAAIMAGTGFKVMSHSAWSERGRPGGDVLLTRVPYTNLYGGEGRQAFRILSPRRGLEIALIVKRQDTDGSNDTKLPHIYLTAIEAMREKTVFILVEGEGWRSEGMDWLRRAVAERRYGMPTDKDVRIVSLEEFRRWARGL